MSRPRREKMCGRDRETSGARGRLEPEREKERTRILSERF